MANKPKVKISIIIVMLIMVTVFAYIFVTNIRDGGRDIEITLPSQIQGTTPVDPGNTTPAIDSQIELVTVTKENVQSVIATMSRPTTYHMTITAKNHYGGETKSRTVDYWVKDGNSRTRTASDNTVRNEMFWEDGAYIWDEGDASYKTYKRGEFSSDASASILTYEDVLSKDPDTVVEAKYVSYNERACIYVSFADEELGYLYEYYISLAEGLLIHGAVTKETTPIYTCEVKTLDVGAFAENIFSLPPDYKPLGVTAE